MPGTEKGDELELLVTFVEIYEKDHFPISNPSPLEAIKFRKDQMNLALKDLVQYIGNKSKDKITGNKNLFKKATG